MGIVIFWIVGAIVVGVIAGSRGRSGFGYFLLSLLLSPLIGLVLTVALPSLNVTTPAGTAAPSQSTHVRCPACAEFVLPEARVCKHCGAALKPDPEFHRKARQAAQLHARDDMKNLWIGLAAVAFVIGSFVVVGKLIG